MTNIDAGQRRPCPGSQLQPPCAGQQPTLVALVPPCNQALLQASTYGGSQKTLSDRGTPSTESYSSNSPCQQQIQLTRPSSTEDYSYPRLRMQLQEQDNQHTSDGYIIVQPDHFIQDRNDTEENACAADKESNGPRGAMDDTL